jgi:hypothetical protein
MPVKRTTKPAKGRPRRSIPDESRAINCDEPQIVRRLDRIAQNYSQLDSALDQLEQLVAERAKTIGIVDSAPPPSAGHAEPTMPDARPRKPR